MGSRRGFRRGVWAVETASWSTCLEDTLTIRHLLSIMRAATYPPTEVIHKTAATAAELEFFIRSWATARNSRYAVLWLSFHGATARLFLGDERRSAGAVDLDWLEERLAGRCARRIIHLGSCGTLKDVHGNRLRRFLRRTGALAVTGFAREVDWLESSAFEVLMLRATSYFVLDRRGMAGFRRYVARELGQSAQRVGFRLVVR